MVTYLCILIVFIMHSLHCIFDSNTVLPGAIRNSDCHSPCQLVVFSPMFSGAHPPSWWSLTGVETNCRPTGGDGACPGRTRSMCRERHTLPSTRIRSLQMPQCDGPCRALPTGQPHHLPLTAGAGGGNRNYYQEGHRAVVGLTG